jgi:hypothetical protein
MLVTDWRHEMASPPVPELERKLIFCPSCEFFCDAEELPAMHEHQSTHLGNDRQQFPYHPIPK